MSKTKSALIPISIRIYPEDAEAIIKLPMFERRQFKIAVRIEVHNLLERRFKEAAGAEKAREDNGKLPNIACVLP
jgi:hypothetical protein